MTYNPSWSYSDHPPDCLLTRYCALSDDDRAYWPDGFSSRPELCTCGINAGAQGQQPEYADHRRELEDMLRILERPAG